MKAARYVWRGALEKGLLKQYLVGCLPYGDIRACFDELDHQVLAHILRKKIQDERFLNLIRKLLKAGYMDLHGSKKESLIGSPQGGLCKALHNPPYAKQVTMQRDMRKAWIFVRIQLNSFA